jgi:hypothetical protein
MLTNISNIEILIYNPNVYLQQNKIYSMPIHQKFNQPFNQENLFFSSFLKNISLLIFVRKM